MSKQYDQIKSNGWKMVLVHMGDNASDLPILNKIGLSTVETLSDPNCELYRSFGLGKGSFWQHFKPSVWIRGFKAAIAGHQVGALAGDGFQLPGTFLLKDGKIVHSHIGRDAADPWPNDSNWTER